MVPERCGVKRPQECSQCTQGMWADMQPSAMQCFNCSSLTPHLYTEGTKRYTVHQHWHIRSMRVAMLECRVCCTNADANRVPASVKLVCMQKHEQTLPPPFSSNHLQEDNHTCPLLDSEAHADGSLDAYCMVRDVWYRMYAAWMHADDGCCRHLLCSTTAAPSNHAILTMQACPFMTMIQKTTTVMYVGTPPLCTDQDAVTPSNTSHLGHLYMHHHALYVSH